MTLQSYFSSLATELDVDSESLTVVVDNAHIPIHFNEDDQQAAFSSSLSALDTAHFPPPFLQETDRWSCMEGSASSVDVSCHMPCRSQDTLDEMIDRVITDEKKSLAPHASIDSAERMLRELPIEVPIHHEGTRRRPTRQNRDAPKSPMRTKDDELPSLKHCPYSEEIEAHPSVGLRRLPESVAVGLTKLLTTDSEAFTTLLDEDDNVGSVGKSKCPTNKVGDREMRPIHSRSEERGFPKLPTNGESLFKRRDITSTPSPNALPDFPYTMISRGCTSSVEGVALSIASPATSRKVPIDRCSPSSQRTMLSVVLER